MQIQKVGSIASSHGIKCILHGPSGSGKTFSISTIPEPDTVLVLSAEAGLLSIRESASNIDAVVIKTTDDLREAYAMLLGDTKYKTVVLDSLSEIAQQILSAELETNKDGRKAYGELNEKAVKLIKSFRDLPGKNVILICQSEKSQDDQSRVYMGPSMPGKKLAQQLPYLCDLVACVRTKSEGGEVKRAFQFLKDEEFEAKDRSGKLNAFEEPNWTVIFNKINGGN